MDYPEIIVSNQKEKSISIQRVNFEKVLLSVYLLGWKWYVVVLYVNVWGTLLFQVTEQAVWGLKSSAHRLVKPEVER